MEEIKPDTFQKPKLHPLLAMLPDYLKDPANYYKIQKAIIEAGATKHSHGEITDWAACKYCQQKQWNRKETMLKLGFKNGPQYMMWKKTHIDIIERTPLVNWKKQ